MTAAALARRGSDRDGGGLVTWLVGTTVIVGVALYLRLVFGASPLDATDVTFALIWGGEVSAGQVPDYDAFGAITPHPLYTALGTLASLFGSEGAFTVVRAVTFLSFGVVVWGVFLLARAVVSTAAGVLAAVAIATNPEIIGNPLAGTVDTPSLALVVLATVFLVRDPRRPGPVFLALFVAGLLRPEVWLFAAAYWLYLAPPLTWRDRVRMAALAASAPLAWAMVDLVVTGNPVFSFTETREIFEQGPGGGRSGTSLVVPIAAWVAATTGPATSVPELIEALRELLRPPELLGAAAGLALSFWLRRKFSAVPAVMAVIGCAVFPILGIAGLSLRPRYLLIAVAMLMVLFSLSALGWQLEERGKRRRSWMVGGLALLAVYAAFVPSELRAIADLRDGVRERAVVREDLRDLVVTRGRPLAERCPIVQAAGLKLVPLVGYHLERSTNDIGLIGVRPPARGMVVAPDDASAGADFLISENRVTQIGRYLRGERFRRVAQSESWSLYAKGCEPA